MTRTFKKGEMNPAYLINDVSTNLEQPPKFRILDVPDLSEEFKTIIKEGYPNLKPLALPGVEPTAVFTAAVNAAKGMSRWEITHADDKDLSIEGVATTFFLRFKDDFTIIIAADGGGSVVNMRSRSRVGKGDMGANAKRIEAFFEMLRAELAV